MKRCIAIVFVLFIGHAVWAQALDCTVTIDARQTGKTQLSIFNTLQQAVQNFINTTQWGDQNLPAQHRIHCSFFITIKSYSGNHFSGTIQVQSSRPVYGSSMTTPLFNFKDDQFEFDYVEHQPLAYNPNRFESNLVSTLSFYAYVILGIDADTFSSDGGTDYFAQANQIASTAQQGGNAGWNVSSGDHSRYELNRELQSSNFANYHQALYVYHRKGLDPMYKAVKTGKEGIAKAINLLEKVHKTRPNTLLIRAFFDAKAHEIAAIFSGGPTVKDKKRIVKELYNMAPTYSTLWGRL